MCLLLRMMGMCFADSLGHLLIHDNIMSPLHLLDKWIYVGSFEYEKDEMAV